MTKKIKARIDQLTLFGASIGQEFKNKSFLDKMKTGLSLAVLFAPAIVFAQPKISSTSALQTTIQTESTSMINIAKILVAVVLAIALVVIIYKISQGTNGAKDALIGWIVAVVVYCIACFII